MSLTLCHRTGMMIVTSRSRCRATATLPKVMFTTARIPPPPSSCGHNMITKISSLGCRSYATDNVTYSGGQANKGQGGFYGSGGARVLTEEELEDAEEEAQKKKMVLVALAHDVEKVTAVMKEVETLEGLLQREGDSPVTGKVIELKSSIKKLMTQPDLLDSLSRLEIEGSPIWGLSSSERELIIMAREKVNEC